MADFSGVLEMVINVWNKSFNDADHHFVYAGSKTT